MKKIKIYLVTYQRENILNDSLDKLFSSDFKNYDNTEVNIINNHTNFKLNPIFEKRVNVLHNVLRPDWSNGNMSENYNHAFINGICDLNNPHTENLVTMQNDAAVHPNWVEHLFEMRYGQGNTLVVGHFGDNVVCHTAESVKKIGMWDENLPHQYKEPDYWIRALNFNKDKTSLNDTLHGTTFNNHNALDIDISDDRNFQLEDDAKRGKDTLKRKPDDAEQQSIWYGSRGGIYATSAWNYFSYKWGGTWKEEPTREKWLFNWTDDFRNNPPNLALSKIKQAYKYIYFEKDIENRLSKGYVNL